VALSPGASLAGLIIDRLSLLHADHEENNDRNTDRADCADRRLTWEGELLLTTLPGVIPEKFLFTVRDDEVANQLAAQAGRRLVLKYSQHKGIPSSCFGDTEYFVESFEMLKND
jgi:hypothetical protein